MCIRITVYERSGREHVAEVEFLIRYSSFVFATRDCARRPFSADSASSETARFLEMTVVKVPQQVSGELENAVYDDWKRQAVDAAKKRAVAQLADYETFKNMVSVAHLKPITAEKSCQGKRSSYSMHTCRSTVWMGPIGHIAGISVTAAALVGKDGNIVREQRFCDGIAGASNDEIAMNGAHFQKAWRRKHITVEARRKYLKQYTPQHLKQLFKVEIDSLLLCEMIDVLLGGEERKPGGTVDSGLTTQTATTGKDLLMEESIAALSMLNAIRCTGNFSITSRLLPRSTIANVKAFFQDVERRCHASEEWRSQVSKNIGDKKELADIAQSFQVSLS